MNRILWTIATLAAMLLFCAEGRAQSDHTGKLRQHVSYLASDSLGGRACGTEGSRKAAAYIHQEMEKAGLVMLNDSPGEHFSLTLESGEEISGINVMGFVEGYDPQFKHEIIVIGANYDNIENTPLMIDGKACETVYPGADKNASGVAVMLEMARKAAREPYLFKRSLLFVAFDAKEKSLMGSWYFTHTFDELDSIRAMIDLDQLGRSGRENDFRMFTIGYFSTVMELLKASECKQAGIDPLYSTSEIAVSDYRMFYEADVPFFYFTTGHHRNHNTVRDTAGSLDYQNMSMITNYVYGFLVEVVRSDKELRASKVKMDSGDSRYLSIYDVDVRPEFMHGDEEKFLKEWVYYYIKYPRSSIEKGVQGTVVVEFVIGAKGRISDVKIVKGLDDAINAEVMKVVSASPKWKPAKLNGEKVSVKISLPIEFILREN